MPKEKIRKTGEMTEQKKFSVVFHHIPEGPTRSYRIEQLNEILQKYAQKINKRDPIERIELTIDQPKNPVGKIIGYGVKLHILLMCGESYVANSDSYVARAQHLGLEKNVRKAAKEIITQIEKHQSRVQGRN